MREPHAHIDREPHVHIDREPHAHIDREPHAHIDREPHVHIDREPHAHIDIVHGEKTPVGSKTSPLFNFDYSDAAVKDNYLVMLGNAYYANNPFSSQRSFFV